MKKLFILIFLLFAPLFCSANIIINEISWMGNEDSHYNEWLELFNNSSTTININNWKIEGGLEINLKGEIKPKGFFS